MVHDTIPLDHPEFSRADAPAVFAAKLAAVSAHADTVIHLTHATKAGTEAHLARLGRVPSGIIAPLGVTVAPPDPSTLPGGLDLTAPYFVILGTIEPRKNHALLLDIWEKFAAEAAALAERNRKRLQIKNCSVVQSNWFSALGGAKFDLIVSNPPYIAADDRHLAEGDVRFEPSSALVAGADGLDDIRLIIQQAPNYLQAGGWLLLEHGFDQAAAVRELLSARGFSAVESRRDLGGHERISLGRFDNE